MAEDGMEDGREVSQLGGTRSSEQKNLGGTLQRVIDA
jgi:hypothetical protein